MSTLTDHVDRISLLAKSVRATAASALASSPDASVAGPFTRAILSTPLGDLIRDIDPSELGLFTLVPPPQAQQPIPDAPPREITRVEFLGATPLRKPPAPRGRMDAQRPREHEPEVYAQAAAKYLDRYQSIRPMPRASEQAEQIIQRLEAVRKSIHELTDQLNQHSGSDPSDPPLSPKSALAQEERQIQDLQSQIAELRKRKEELAKRKSRAQPKSRLPPKPETPKTPDLAEQTFWNTPGTKARTLHFTGESLLDEEVDVGNISAISFDSPVIPRRVVRSALSVPDEEQEEEEPAEDADETAQPEVEDGLEEDEGGDATPEPTVVILKKRSVAADVPLPTDDTESSAPGSEPEPDSGPSQSDPPPETPLHASRPAKVKVTTELERMVEKIWATVGEIIMPGHPFDTLGKSANKSRPPRAKETMSYLRELANQTPAPASPSASSFSSLASAPPPNAAGPNAQQVLTAHMLLTLLTDARHALGLKQLKEVLAAKSAAIGVGTGPGLMGGSAVTKPLYGCVAKRLLKIERGAGEQVVQFDL